MSITSIQFLGFCLCAIILFLVFPRKYRWISLLISSLAFYLISAKSLIGFIILTSLTTWIASRWIDRIEGKAQEARKAATDKAEKKQIKQRAQKKKGGVLFGALIINIGILAAMKIFNYFTAAFVFLAGVVTGGAAGDALTIILPLGISYYTFSTVGYLLDVYWKRYESEPNFIRFFTYAIYFPHILQGPISRYNKLGAELKKPRLMFTWDNFVTGMESILLGCFKKLVIADRAGVFVSNTLLVHDMSGGTYLLAMVLDAIQIYADFSGYMDIVSGVSKMFDVELEQNFNHPFLSKSVPEFWRRWHMSLGSWFKDYVYYPLTMSKRVKKIGKRVRGWKSPHLQKIVTLIIPVMITWLLTGLWHGSGPGYVMWGVWYGSWILMSVTFLDDIRNFMQKRGADLGNSSWRVFQTLKIFCIFMGGRFWGTSMGVEHRIEIFRQIIGKSFLDFSVLQHGLDRNDFLIIVIGVAVLIAIAAIEQKENLFVWFNRQNRVFCGVVLWAMLFAVFLLGIYGPGFDVGNFMYQQF